MTAPIPVRVMVLDAWDEIALDLDPSTPVGEAKAEALRRARVPWPADRYVLKYNGAAQSDTASLAEIGVRPRGALIVLSRRRIPVR